MENNRGEKLSFKAGQIILREGEPSRGFYILMEGRLGVFKDNIKVSEFAEKGLLFGELGMILEKPRTATIMALEPSIVLFIKTDIDDLIIRFPSITNNLLYNLAERLYNTTGDYVASVRILEDGLSSISK